jgi:hypothetical protein
MEDARDTTMRGCGIPVMAGPGAAGPAPRRDERNLLARAGAPHTQTRRRVARPSPDSPGDRHPEGAPSRKPWVHRLLGATEGSCARYERRASRTAVCFVRCGQDPSSPPWLSALAKIQRRLLRMTRSPWTVWHTLPGRRREHSPGADTLAPTEGPAHPCTTCAPRHRSVPATSVHRIGPYGRRSRSFGAAGIRHGQGPRGPLRKSIRGESPRITGDPILRS